MTDLAALATRFLGLHQDAKLLTLVNVWDVVSARVVAAAEGTVALATASHSIAASRGYEDGENIPVDEMLEEVRRITAATDLPVTADLEAGYGDAGETVRKAIGLGVVGANIEDQMKPLDEAVAAVRAVMAAAQAEGVPDFVLNARTDAVLRAGDRPRTDVMADVIERGRAFLDAGAPVVFVPGRLDEDEIASLVEAFGPQRLTVIGVPGLPPLARLQQLSVARVSFGPIPQRVALTALQKLAEDVSTGGGVPDGTRLLN
jgi:2-methylisocitrate lyase-like PEP mutase family enzyme